MSDHEQTLTILNSIQKILADHPGTLMDHQKRINSVQFLQMRLNKLNELENPQDKEPDEEEPEPELDN